MPIIDYERASKKAYQNLVSKLNATNKDHLDKFLKPYDVSPARLNMFLKHIQFLLQGTKDIKKEMHDPDKINELFKEWRDNLSQSYYSTIVNVSLRFVKWLNDDEKPKGFKDIKNNGKNKQRDLEADDMITWEEGLKIAGKTNSTQFKAIIMTQLDGGFRPSEFIDLNYGDIKYEKPFFIANVRQGKTGKRDVPLYKAVPYLKAWLNQHPSKKKGDPLWIMEYITFSSAKKNEKGVCKYKYPAMLKRIRATARACGVDKPTDFYNFRHSACTIAKLENTPPDLAAEKFGHSVKYFTETYGRLDIKGKLERFKGHIGLEEEKDTKKNKLNVVCSLCGFDNPPKIDVCEKCLNPLTVSKALEMKSEKDKELEKLKEQVDNIYKFIEQSGLSNQILNKAKERKIERTKNEHKT